jgi:hypothetical protein
MPKILNLDEMLDVLNEIDPSGRNQDYGQFKRELEALGTRMANVISTRLDVDCTPATSEGTAFAGTCACFYAKFTDQVLPAEIESFDTGGEWHTRQEADAEMAELRESISAQA